MKYTHLYIIIKQLLIDRPELRDSDKKLLWAVWEKEGHVFAGRLSYGDWISPSLTSAETVTRTRRKLQETIPSLRASIPIQNLRRRRQKSKGTFIYREPITFKFTPEGTAIPIQESIDKYQ